MLGEVGVNGSSPPVVGVSTSGVVFPNLCLTWSKVAMHNTVISQLYD